MPLNPKQKRFVDEYLVDLNGTQAAIRAGYSERTAKQQGSRLLTHADVKIELSKRQEKASGNKLALTVERVDQEIARLAFVDIRRLYDANGNLLPPKDWPDDVAGAVAGIETVEEYKGRGESRKVAGYTKKLKLWDKTSALTLAAKRLRLITDKPTVNVNITLEQLVMASIKATAPEPETPQPKEIADGKAA